MLGSALRGTPHAEPARDRRPPPRLRARRSRRGGRGRRRGRAAGPAPPPPRLPAPAPKPPPAPPPTPPLPPSTMGATLGPVRKEHNVDLGGGALGVRLTVPADTWGMKGRTIAAVVFFVDAKGDAI